MIGAFTGMANGKNQKGDTIALLICCVSFFPVGVLAYKHFNSKTGHDYPPFYGGKMQKQRAQQSFSVLCTLFFYAFSHGMIANLEWQIGFSIIVLSSSAFLIFFPEWEHILWSRVKQSLLKSFLWDSKCDILLMQGQKKNKYLFGNLV